MSRNWAKKDANYYQNPKILNAGFWGAVVFDALLLLNRQHRCDGHIKPSLCRPEYLLRYVMLDEVVDDLKRPPVELVKVGLRKAQAAKLIVMSTLGIQIVGWGPEWRNGDSAERMQALRQRRKDQSDGVTSRDGSDVRGEERRVEERRDRNTDPPAEDGEGAAPLERRQESQATTLAHQIARESGLDGDALTEPKRKRGKPEAPAEALAIALLLVGYVAENNPEGKIAQLSELERERKAQSWADPIRLLHEQDKISWGAIEGMVHWCQRSEFWRSVILSGANLRDKWESMAAQRGRGTRAPAATTAPATGRADPAPHDQHVEGEVAL